MRDPIPEKLRQGQVCQPQKSKTINLIITLIEILNPTGSATSSCLCNAGKLGDDEGDVKEKEQIPRRNLDHITFNDCG